MEYTLNETSFLRDYSIDERSWEGLTDAERRALIAYYTGECQMAESTRKMIIRNYISEFIKGNNADEERNLDMRKKILIAFASFSREKYSLLDYDRAKKALDESHEGLEYLKEDLLSEVLSAVLRKGTPRPILLLGEPGTGKTTILTSLAKALGRGYEIISLSGLSGVFELKGNSTAWKDAKCGRILQTCIREESLSPVIIFDELEKYGRDVRYGNATTALLDLLEDDRKAEFVDDYLQSPIDLSGVWTIFTANTLEGIPESVLDRLRVIEIKSYDSEELEKIARRMIARTNNEIAPNKIVFSDKAIKRLVFETALIYSSARSIREEIYEIFKKKAFDLLTGNKSILIEEKDIEEHFKMEPIELIEQKRMENVPGFVNGIGCAPSVAFLSPIEVSFDDTRRGLNVLGMCGEEMKESAVIAYAAAEAFIAKKYKKKIPGVILNFVTSLKKNGNSGALATAIAIISESRKESVSEKIAITGALTLKGLVLPIGMVNAKISAAINAGMKRVIIPQANWKDVSSDLKEKIEISYVSTLEEAVNVAFKSFTKNTQSLR